MFNWRTAIAGFMAGVVVILATPAAYAGTPYRNAEFGFELTAPDGWIIYGNKVDDLVASFEAPGDSAIHCMVHAQLIESLAQGTAEEIQQWVLSGGADPILRKALASPNAQIRREARDGFAVAMGESTTNVDGAPRRSRILSAPGPGRVVTVYCGGPPDRFERYAADFDAVLASLRLMTPGATN